MNSESKTIFSNALVLSVTEILVRLMGMILIMVVARKLGPKVMGIYGFALTFIAVFEIVVSFGLDDYIQREVGRDGSSAPSLLVYVLALKAGLYVICLVLILALLPFLAVSSLKMQVVWISAASMFFRTNLSDICAFFRGRQMSHLQAVVMISFRVVYFSLGLAAILSGYGLLALVGLECLAQAVAFGGSIWLFHRKIGLVLIRPAWSKIVLLAKASWNFFLVSIVQTLFNSADLLMLSVISGDLYTGFYAAALKLMGAFDLLPHSLSGAFLPVLSRTALTDPEEFHRRFSDYFRYVFWMGVGLGVIFYALSEDLLVLLFGEEFRPAGPTLQLLATALVLVFANWPLSMAIISLNKERLILRSFSICTVFNILTNLWFIPRLMDQGAAWTTIFSELFFLILQCHILGPSFRKAVGLAHRAAASMAVGLLSYGVLALFSAWQLGWIVKLVAFAPVFMVFSLLGRIVSISELGQGVQFLLKKTERDTDGVN